MHDPPPTFRPALLRSLLFVPGNRPEIFDKALGSGADAVCVDLEDAVAPGGKPAARGAGLEFLAGDGAAAATRAVRINGLRTLDGLRDLAALAEARPAAGLVIIPKVDAAEELRIADAVLSEAGAGCGLVALIETLRGLEAVSAVAAATPRLVGLMFGAVDFAAEIGAPVEPEPLLFARSRIAAAARAAGLDALDVPSLSFRDLAAVEAEAAYAKRLGFTGKAAIHPTNPPAIHRAFDPTPDEVAQAEQVVAAYGASATGVAVLDGKLVEKPVVRAMEQVLARARAGAAAGLDHGRGRSETSMRAGG